MIRMSKWIISRRKRHGYDKTLVDGEYVRLMIGVSLESKLKSLQSHKAGTLPGSVVCMLKRWKGGGIAKGDKLSLLYLTGNSERENC